MTQTKRLMIFISLTVFFAAPCSLTFSAETPLKTINVAVPAVSLLQAPLFIAIDAGAFKKYGMDVRYIVTGGADDSGAGRRLRSLRSGRF